MRLLLIVIYFFSFSLSALELEFHDPKKNYTLKINEAGLDFKSSFAEYSIVEDKCNKNFLKTFKDDIKQNFRFRAISSKPEKSFYVRKDSEVLSLAKKSPLGQFLFSMDKQIAHLKLKEKIHCE